MLDSAAAVAIPQRTKAPEAFTAALAVLEPMAQAEHHCTVAEAVAAAMLALAVLPYSVARAVLVAPLERLQRALNQVVVAAVRLQALLARAGMVD